MTTNIDNGAGKQPGARWRARLTDEPLAPPCGPVPLLTGAVAGEKYAWDRESGDFHPYPDLDRLTDHHATDVLGSGGRELFFERVILIDDETLRLLDRLRSRGLYRYDFASGQTDVAGYLPMNGRSTSVVFGASPDGRRLAVVQAWPQAEPDGTYSRDAMRATLHIAGFDGDPTVTHGTFRGACSSGVEDVGIQWSPDGSWIALACWREDAREQRPGWHPSILIIDPADGREVQQIRGVDLAGSASWSPDSTRLLVVQNERAFFVHDLHRGTRSLVDFDTEASRALDRKRTPRVLGFAGHDRLLLANPRGRTMLINTLELSTGRRQPLINYTGTDYMYLTMAQMPIGYWDELA